MKFEASKKKTNSSIHNEKTTVKSFNGSNVSKFINDLKPVKRTSAVSKAKVKPTVSPSPKKK